MNPRDKGRGKPARGIAAASPAGRPAAVAHARPATSAPAARTDPAAEARALADAAAALGLALSAGQQQHLLDYCALLRRWNSVYNLTAIRDPAAMLVQHLFDCLAIVPPLRAAPGAAGGRDLLHDGATILDVGSGGGLPGVVLAICAPGARVICVDAVGKKTAFITQVRADLGLTNLEAIHARVEDLQAPRDLPAASLIVSRAFSSLAQFVSLTRHLIAPDGVWAAMKGQLPGDEIEALPAPVGLRATITLAVPQLDAQRHLLLMAG